MLQKFSINLLQIWNGNVCASFYQPLLFYITGDKAPSRFLEKYSSVNFHVNK